jgi:hypothetical protein
LNAPDPNEEHTLVPTRVYRDLLRESRQVEVLGYLVAAMGVGATLLLFNAGDRSFWMVGFGIVGVVAALWTVMTSRRHNYRVGRGGIPPAGTGGPPYVDRTVRPMLETPTHIDSSGAPGS